MTEAEKSLDLGVKLFQQLTGARGSDADATLLIQGGAELTLANSEKITTLMCAAAERRTAVLQAMLKSGRDIALNAQDDHGWTALITAAHRGNAEGVQLLLEAGADLKIKDQIGRDALSYAEASGDPAKAALIRRWTMDASFAESATVAAAPVPVKKPLRLLRGL